MKNLLMIWVTIGLIGCNTQLNDGNSSTVCVKDIEYIHSDGITLFVDKDSKPRQYNY